MKTIHSGQPRGSESILDLLLAEQHHRFANSFQIVAALASECHRSRDAIDTGRLVQNLDERLQALAGLHRLLASDFDMADFADHVREIARELVRAFGRKDAVVLRIDRFWVPEEHRLRLALIICELVTNSLKHSLANSAEGLIEISARANAGNVVLTVADSNRRPLNGVWPAPSSIVAGLARSIGGIADVVDANGYVARVCLPRETSYSGAAVRPWEIVKPVFATQAAGVAAL